MRKIIIWLSTILIAATMLTAAPLTYTAHALTEEEEAWVNEARAALQEILAEREVMAVVYLSDKYSVREAATADSDVVVKVPSGQTVLVRDVVIDDDYQAWSHVTFSYKGVDYQGYVQRNNLACSDERFLEWEMNYGMNPGNTAMYALEDGEIVYADVEAFPESYQSALTALKEKYPNWIFVAQNVDLDWNTVIANEIIGGKSLVEYTYPEYCKEGAYDDGHWFYASKEILELYMDPRNSLHEDAIFQFEQLTYNESYHTEAAIDKFLEKTFMNSSQNAPENDMTYAHIFWTIGAEEKREISPFHLAARVLQEQGTKGGSDLISGTYPGYEGYYNYFNVKASGTTTEEVIVNGLKYAVEQDWHDAYFSILGGADLLSRNYISCGQDTTYLQKYNVAPDNPKDLYGHQYMQNIAAPTSEAKSMRNLYDGANALDSAFVFKIPVYKNMPETACPMPTSSTNVVLQVPEGYTNTTVYVEGVPYNTVSRNGRQIVTAVNGNAKSAVAFKYNAGGTPIGMYVWTLEYKNDAYTATPQPELADLLTYHGFSVRITGKSGIRFKTGIDAALRGKLATTGVNGYKLKEYGTLVMNNANRGIYPMVKGGEKVMSGMSYGTDTSGQWKDVIFETVSGRHRFTSVLVGLPVAQYKTEFAFGGYLVLEKDGVQTTIYGPVVAKSIYSLAQQILDSGIYKSGSEAEVFLRKLIADANALPGVPAGEGGTTNSSGAGTVSGGDAQ